MLQQLPAGGHRLHGGAETHRAAPRHQHVVQRVGERVHSVHCSGDRDVRVCRRANRARLKPSPQGPASQADGQGRLEQTQCMYEHMYYVLVIAWM